MALILIGFTSTATFQLWLNCAQTFGKEIAGISAEKVSVMTVYYSAGTMVALVVTSLLITKFKQVRFLVIYPAISVVMLILVYLIKTPVICFVGAFVIGYAAAGGVLQMATAVVNDLFPRIKGTITSLVMIASSLCNYTILTAASKMTATNVIVMNIVITVIGVLLAVFVNVRYGVLLKKLRGFRKINNLVPGKLLQRNVLRSISLQKMDYRIFVIMQQELIEMFENKKGERYADRKSQKY